MLIRVILFLQLQFVFNTSKMNLLGQYWSRERSEPPENKPHFQTLIKNHTVSEFR